MNKIDEGLPQIGGELAQRMQIRFDTPEEVNVSGGDVVPTMKNCRGIESDADGQVRVTMRCDSDGIERNTILTLFAGVTKPVGNIVKVFRYTSGTTETLCTVTKASDGTSVAGIKLWR